LMQGNIGAQSTINQGSVFWISLNSITPNSINAIFNKNDSVKKSYKSIDSSTNVIDSEANKKIKADQIDAQIMNEEFFNDDLAKPNNKSDAPATKTMVFEGSDLQRLLALQSQSMDNAFKKIGLQSSFETDLTLGTDLTPGTDLTLGDDILPAAEFSQYSVNTLSSKQSSTPLKKLLYVEDNSANFNLVQEMVALRDDIQLKGATDGVQGLSIAETWLPDVILMDIKTYPKHATLVNCALCPNIALHQLY